MLSFEELLESPYYLSLWNNLGEFKPRLILLLDHFLKEIIINFPELEENNFKHHEALESKEDASDGYLSFDTPDVNLYKENKLYPFFQYIDSDKHSYVINSVKAIWNVIVKTKQLLETRFNFYGDDVKIALENVDFFNKNFAYLDAVKWVPKVINDKTLKLSVLLFNFYLNLWIKTENFAQQHHREKANIIVDVVHNIKLYMAEIFKRITEYNNNRMLLLLSEVEEAIHRNENLLLNKIQRVADEKETVTVEKIFQNAIKVTKELPVSVMKIKEEIHGIDLPLYDQMESLTVLISDPNDPLQQVFTNRKLDERSVPEAIDKLKAQQKLLEAKLYKVRSIDLVSMFDLVTRQYQEESTEYEEARNKLDYLNDSIQLFQTEEKNQINTLENLKKQKTEELIPVENLYDSTIQSVKSQISQTKAVKSNFGFNTTNITRLVKTAVRKVSDTEGDASPLSPKEVEESKSTLDNLEQMKKGEREKIEEKFTPLIDSLHNDIQKTQLSLQFMQADQEKLVMQCKNQRLQVEELAARQSVVAILIKFQKELTSLTAEFLAVDKTLGKLNFQWSNKKDFLSQSETIRKFATSLDVQIEHCEMLGAKLEKVATPLLDVLMEFSKKNAKQEETFDDLILQDMARELQQKAEALTDYGLRHVPSVAASLKQAYQDRERQIQEDRAKIVAKYTGVNNDSGGKLDQYWNNRNQQIGYRIADAAAYLFTSCFGRKTEKQLMKKYEAEPELLLQKYRPVNVVEDLAAGSYLFACFFGRKKEKKFREKTELELRTDYLAQLKVLLNEYNVMDFSNKDEFEVRSLVSPLLTHLDNGIKQFKARTSYQHSLNSYLTDLFSDVCRHTDNTVLLFKENSRTLSAR